jgi:hypothetical protein
VGAWGLMQKKIPASQFTRSGDPLKIDMGYEAGQRVKMFHALSLEHDIDTAKVLGFSFPRMAEGILRKQKQQAELTAIVEDGLPTEDDGINFALEILAASEIKIATMQQLPAIANTAARELGLQ